MFVSSSQQLEQSTSKTLLSPVTTSANLEFNIWICSFLISIKCHIYLSSIQCVLSYFESQAPVDNCHVNVLYFLQLTMRVCHQVMMSGVKCHPHIRRMGDALTLELEEKITELISSTLPPRSQNNTTHDPSWVTELL